MEEDIVAGLKRMGVSPADARRAVAESRGQGATIEERLRAAFAVLRTLYARQKGWRCEEELLHRRNVPAGLVIGRDTAYREAWRMR